MNNSASGLFSYRDS